MKRIISIILVLVFGLASTSYAEEDTWTTKANMPTGRYVLSSSVVDGIIYAIGGDAGSRASVVEAYDPATDTWARKANMPMGRGAGASSVVNGRIYYMGGRLGAYGANISSVIEYNPTTDTWTAKANMPTPRTWLCSSVVNGKIYVIGGALIVYGAPLSRVDEYDPVTDTWTRKTDMPTPRVCVSTSAVNGKIYAIGGSPGNPWYQGLSTVEEYDPETDTWTRKTDMPTPRTYFSTCVVNGKIYAIGGVKSGGADHVAQLEEYDPATDTWTTKADMPTARSGLATSAVNGKIYAIGGYVGGGTSITTVEEYDTGLGVPSPDFNGDYRIDIEDLILLIECWDQDEPALDIAPPPFGDGIIDILDLELLMSYWGQSLDDPTLIAHWPLDETEGMIVSDNAGDNGGYALGDPVWQPTGGQVDGALLLDGVDDFISTPAILNPADGPFSIFIWVYGGAAGQAIISEIVGPLWLSLDPLTGRLMTELTEPGRSGSPLLSQTAINDGYWHRIGLVWNGMYRTLFVDDIIVAEDKQSNLEGSTSGLYIGCGDPMQPSTFFSGLIDDVRIYNRAVTP